MSVAPTSIAAYRDHQAAGKIGLQSQQILDTMLPGRDYSRRELSAFAGLELSSVCGRVNEMLGIGMIEEGPPRKCKVTGKTIKPVSKVL